jgi:hypothetical protein
VFRAISIRAKWGLATFILRQRQGGAAFPAGLLPRSHGSGIHSHSYITKVCNRNGYEAVYCWFILEMSRVLIIQTLRTLFPTSNTDSY